MVRSERESAFEGALAAEAAGQSRDAQVNGRCTDWPHEEPDACPQGNLHWSSRELKASVPDFAKVYAKRPITKNENGMGINHAFSLWFTARALKPKYVIESGVYHGQSTWLLRQAVGPEAGIFSLDPEPESALVYRDTNSTKTEYFLGDKFIDVGQMDWDSHIPLEDRERTLVMLDDHASSVRRVQELLAHGFVHLWYDDNWRVNGDCYSFSWVCHGLPRSTISVPYRDHGVVEDISVHEHNLNVQYLTERIETYFEFPALLDGCHNSTGLYENVSELVAQGFPSLEDEVYGYWSLHPPYVKLRSPVFVDNLLHRAGRIGWAIPGNADWTRGLVGWLRWILG